MCRMPIVFGAWTLMLGLPLAAGAAAVATHTVSGQQADDESGGAATLVSPVLIGVWRAIPEQLAFTSEFEWSIWGRNASTVRDVVLTVRPSGDGVLTVTRRVVDARGRTQSATVEEAKILVAGVLDTPTSRVDHGVKVVSAERRYSDDPRDKWALENLRVQLMSFNETDDMIEVRFETPEGPGSFWERLRREGRRPSPRPPR